MADCLGKGSFDPPFSPSTSLSSLALLRLRFLPLSTLPPKKSSPKLNFFFPFFTLLPHNSLFISFQPLYFLFYSFSVLFSLMRYCLRSELITRLQTLSIHQQPSVGTRSLAVHCEGERPTGKAAQGPGDPQSWRGMENKAESRLGQESSRAPQQNFPGVPHLWQDSSPVFPSKGCLHWTLTGKGFFSLKEPLANTRVFLAVLKGELAWDREPLHGKAAAY